jgi:hypothetical protein
MGRMALLLQPLGCADRFRRTLSLGMPLSPTESRVTPMNRKVRETVSPINRFPVLSHESYNIDFGSCDNVATPLAVSVASLSKQPLGFIRAK